MMTLDDNGRSSNTQFKRYVGIDYSGAETPTSGLKGLRVYMATSEDEAEEVMPPSGPKRYWTRQAVAHWLLETLSQPTPTIVGIDHGFSFPIRYFEYHQILPDWDVFLRDFRRHWPTDEPHVYVDFVRDGLAGNGAARTGNAKWRRIILAARARSQNPRTPASPGCCFCESG